MSVTPETTAASTPTGLKVDLRLPQETTLAPTGLAEADLKDTTVTLPEGMQVSPSSANGLQACAQTAAGIGFAGFAKLSEGEGAAETTTFSPGFNFTSPNPSCPDGSKLGIVHIKTPLLPRELEGAVYLAEQNANPFGSLLALYIVAEDPTSGVLVKLAGEVHLDGQTGQLVSTFKSTPQLPFEQLKLEFFGGPHGPVSTPARCGSYATTASLTPWSDGTPVESSSGFAITSGPGGAACANPLPFAPSLTAGSTNIQAGAFTSFSTTFSRQDGNQNIAGVTLHLPEGLLGRLAAVTPCHEPQAALGTCPAGSLIGHTVASVGLGSDPYTVTGGQVFLTSSYKGAPYGLSVAQTAKAGPFDLGSGSCDCVVVRARLEVDQHSAAVTVVSDPLPTMLQGIPLQLKHVNVTIDRAGFTFNPTNCSALSINGTLAGEQGATAPMSVPFAVTNCATLPFKPKFTAMTLAHASKQAGASLDVKIASRGGPQPGGGEANIRSVKVDLPRQMPSRLTTLQKACLARVFEADPAACPKESNVGTATASTPVLAHPLSGPAYLVSHGAAGFPDLEIALQGEGILLILDGKTDIKHGITSSTFRTVPDAPISSFELKLPTGRYSILGSYLPHSRGYSFCGQHLSMPTRITGQDGAVINQTTRIAITGCPRAKHHARRAGRARRPGHQRTRRRGA